MSASGASGKLRAYKIDGGYFGVKDGVFGWQPPRVQMLFQLVGAHNEGVVTVEAVKRGASLRLELLALDVLSQSSRGLFLLQGGEHRLHVVGQLRGLLQTERAKYLAQTVEEDVDDELEGAGHEVMEELREGRE